MSMNYMTDLKRAEGRGSGRDGTRHHWQMILSSIAMALAVPVFVFTFGMVLGGDREAVLAFLSRPVPAILLAVSLVVCIRHFMFEALEAIEDYVHGTRGKLALFATTAMSYLMMIIGVFAIAKIAI